MKLQKGKINITIDGQFGSTGKGLLNSVIAEKDDTPIDFAISNAAPNAGHTYDVGKGKKTVYHLPVSGVLRTNSTIYLCAGSIIDPEVLAKEITDFNVDGRVVVHPRACILLPEHKHAESDPNSGATKLASTQKGVGAALADKIRRSGGLRTAGEYYSSNEIKVIDLDAELLSGKTALMEVPQGFGLSVNHGLSYPHCTSRDITVASALNDAGVHPKHLGRTYLSLRSFPIRVGHIYDEHGVKIGDSGPFYADSDERGWEELGLEPELTTVTKRVRRVATFSWTQYKAAIKMLQPDLVFLNFCNYFANEAHFREVAVRMEQMNNQVWGNNGHRPEYWFGFGPHVDDVVGSVDAMREILLERKVWTDEIRDPSSQRSYDFLGLHGVQAPAERPQGGMGEYGTSPALQTLEAGSGRTGDSD